VQYSDEQRNYFNGRAILIMSVSKILLTFFLPCRSFTSKLVALLDSRKNQCRAVPVAAGVENAEA
jgi:hypothetical protein